MSRRSPIGASRCIDLNRFEEALASYDRALAVRPDYAKAFVDRGDTLRELKRFEEALASYDRAIALRPDYVEAHCQRRNVPNADRRLRTRLAKA